MNIFLRASIVIFSVLICTRVLATNYFVSPSGSETVTGISAQKPTKYALTIQDSLHAGDTLFFMNGVHLSPYTDAPILEIKNSGTPEAPIVITNYLGHQPKLKFASWEGIKISGASYIKIENLIIEGPNENILLEEAENQTFPITDAKELNWINCYDAEEGEAESLFNGQGILIVGYNLRWSPDSISTTAHHVTVSNCEIFNCGSSGIAAQQADYITISRCTIYNNCWYTLFGTSAINLYQLINTDSTLTVHNIIERNILYNNKLLLNPTTTNCKRFDGNGIIIDDSRHAQKYNYKNKNITFDSYTGHTVIRNNIITNNGGSGISVFKSNNIHILNNTLVRNGLFLETGLNPGEIALGDYDNIVLKNNILFSDTSINVQIESNNKHTLFLYEVDGPVGDVQLKNNLFYGENRSSLDLPDCESCYDQINPLFNSVSTNSEWNFIPTSNYLTQTGITDSLLALGDYLGSSINPSTPSIGAIEINGALCGQNGLISQKESRTNYTPSIEKTYAPTFNNTTNLTQNTNPCSQFFINSGALAFEEFTIYPNIVQNGNYIYFSSYTPYQLYDVRGILILKSEVETFYIDTILLAKGLYLLHTNHGVQKIIIH